MTETELKEDDIVLCTVKRIEGNIVFLEIKGDGEGSMIFAEVSPGRIRNIRDFVAPNKKIVCKILKIKDGHPQLSLRRVTTKEKEEVLEQDKKEKMLLNMLKIVFKEKTPSVIEEISKKYDPAEFLDEAREDTSILKKYAKGSDLEQLEKIFSEKKEKEKEVSEKITIKSQSSSGLEDIKEVLKTNEAEIKYLGSSKFSILIKAKDYKTANSKMEKLIQKIKQKAKELKVSIETKQSK